MELMNYLEIPKDSFPFLKLMLVSVFRAFSSFMAFVLMFVIWGIKVMLWLELSGCGWPFRVMGKCRFNSCLSKIKTVTVDLSLDVHTVLGEQVF